MVLPGKKSLFSRMIRMIAARFFCRLLIYKTDQVLVRKGGRGVLPVSEALKKRLRTLNRELREMYPPAEFRVETLRQRLDGVGTFFSVDKWSEKELQSWLGEGLLIGVDGSVNSTSGAHPHTLSVFQALAKGTRGQEHWEAEVYTPLLEPEEETGGGAAREARRRGTILSGLELRAALEAVRRWSPRVVMMDGSLRHFMLDDARGWNALKAAAEQAGVLLVGVSEEIGTRGLVRELFPDRPTWSDRDILYGVLRPGEAYAWEGWNASDAGLWKVVIRSSGSPQPVGIDGLLSQQEHRGDLIRLCRTLTPESGRGIPLWLDIVDAEVRVTDPLVEAMVEEYLDPDLLHRLLVPKRSERHL